MTSNMLTLFGNQLVLIQVKHQQLFSGYGVFLETHDRNGLSSEDEYRYFVESMNELIAQNKGWLSHRLRHDKEIGKILNRYTHEANEHVQQRFGSRLEMKQLGFYANQLTEKEYQTYLKERDIWFTERIEFEV